MNILFLGNASYLNRGCEAIVRGTMEAFDSVLGVNYTVSNGSFIHGDSLMHAHKALETDARVRNFSLHDCRESVHYPRRFSVGWARRQMGRVIGKTPKVIGPYRSLRHSVVQPDIAMQIGGDNYTLDYGLPTQFLEVDYEVLSWGVPLVLWGASVGPFSTVPEFEARVAKHFAQFSAIFVREDRSVQYLRSFGLAESVHRMEDPAFLMKPLAPADTSFAAFFEQPVIGVNLSPLVYKFRDHRNLETWVDESLQIVTALLRRFPQRLALVPHVTMGFGKDMPCDDFNQADDLFLECVFQRLSERDRRRVLLVGNDLSAPNLKWIIGRCQCFVGARTHATIAAFSSGVPTVSLAYSEKARGINESLFGHARYCVDTESLTVEGVISAVETVLEEQASVRHRLSVRLPEIERSVHNAAKALADLVTRPAMEDAVPRQLDLRGAA